MPRLPERPNFEHLKKQAKDLLRAFQAQEPEALERFRTSLPAAKGKPHAEIAAMELKLHDAQSCIAREHHLPTWLNLKNYVDWKNSRFSKDRKDTVPLWLHKVYGHDGDHPKPQFAAKVLEESPELVGDDLYAACAAGDEDVIRKAIAADPECVRRTAKGWRCPGCKKMLAMPPLIAVTFSTLVQVPEYRERMYRCAQLLIDAGADVNDASYKENDCALPALFGAAGKNHDLRMTRLLLDAGANPNDGESLFHSLEGRGIEIARTLLKAGATVDGNILRHCLDQDDLEKLKLLLPHTNEVTDGVVWAIERGRSRAHVELLIAAGAERSAYKLALQRGRKDLADLLQEEPLTIEEEFIAACAAADETEARRMLAGHPDMIAKLSDTQLQQLPVLTAAGNGGAVRLMVKLGWPITVKAGDWNASAINHAVFAGDSALARFLLENGASWTETHGFGDNVNGTLSWASRNMSPENDYVGCAQALLDHGMPLGNMDGEYGDAVMEFVAAERKKHAG